MLARQRQSEILRELESDGSVAVAKLAERLAVTDETIRRDLSRLAEEGLVVRTHGGAVKPDPHGRDAPFAQRQVMNVDAKREIAAEAARLVLPGQVIGIDASTTGFEFARQLSLKYSGPPITVVTNGLDAVNMLAGREGIRVYSTGGELDADGASFVGTIAESAFKQFGLHRVFLSCKGFDAERGPSEASLSHAAVKRAMLAAAEKSVLLVDSTKFGIRSTCFVTGLDSYDSMIVDRAASGLVRAVAGPEVVVASLSP